MEEQEQVLDKGRRLDCGHIAATNRRVHYVRGRWLCFECAVEEQVRRFMCTTVVIPDALVRHRTIRTYPAERVFVQPPRNRWRAFVNYMVGA